MDAAILEPRRVLVVDADADTGKGLRWRLEPYGRQVLCAAAAERGLALARDVWPNMIILDMRLPGPSGHSAFWALRQVERTRDIPIMLAAAAEDLPGSLLDAAASSPGVEIFFKGLGLDALAQRVEQTLSRRHRGPRPAGHLLVRGPIEANLATREVTLGGAVRQALRTRPFDLLCALMRSPGPMSRRELYRQVWREGDNLNNVDVTILRLRDDIKAFEPAIRIESTPDGYRLAVDEAAVAASRPPGRGSYIL